MMGDRTPAPSPARQLEDAIETVLRALRMEWHRREGIPASGVLEDPYTRLADDAARSELASALPRLIATFTLTSEKGFPLPLTGRALLANLDFQKESAESSGRADTEKA
jgi:hypothetical protein